MFKRLTNTPLWRDRPTRTVTLAVVSLIGNLLYAFYHGALGLAAVSPWLLMNGVYYLLLAVARFAAVLHARRDGGRAVSRGVGVLLFFMSGLLGGLLTHSLRQPVATAHSTVPMITIATVTFTKITLAAVTATRHRRLLPLSLRTINAIRYAEVAVSLCTMQRSMLATFDKGDTNVHLLNLLTGIGVCLFVLFLGLYLFHITRKELPTHGKIPHC